MDDVFSGIAEFWKKFKDVEQIKYIDIMHISSFFIRTFLKANPQNIRADNDKKDKANWPNDDRVLSLSNKMYEHKLDNCLGWYTNFIDADHKMKELSKFIIIYTVLMTAQTLYNLVDSIQVSRIRLTRYHLPDQNNAPWTPEEEKLLFNVSHT